MSVLALITDEDSLSAAEAARQLDLLRRAQDYVRTCRDVDELMDAWRKARLVREWVRLHNAAEALALEACKLAWLALRGLGQLDPAAIKSTRSRAAARWLADMDQHEFDYRLAAMHYPEQPATVRETEQRKQERAWALDHGRAIGQGEILDAQLSADELADAIDTVLSAAEADGMSSVEGLSRAVVRALGLESESGHPLVREGLEQVIRQAVRAQELPDGYPAWITWRSDSAGWVHIPWDAATLDQLKWMAEFRAEQARQMAKAALQLAGLVRLMRAYSARLGGAQRLEILRRAREQAQEERDRAYKERARTARQATKSRRPPAADTRSPCTGTARTGSRARPCRNPAMPGTDRCEYHPPAEPTTPHPD